MHLSVMAVCRHEYFSKNVQHPKVQIGLESLVQSQSMSLVYVRPLGSISNTGEGEIRRKNIGWKEKKGSNKGKGKRGGRKNMRECAVTWFPPPQHCHR